MRRWLFRPVLVVMVVLSATAAAAQSTNILATDPSTKVISNVGDASNNALRVNIVAGAAAGGTSSLLATVVPTAGTAAGYSDGTNLQLGRVFDADSGGGTQYVLGANLRRSGSGGSVELLGQTTMANSLPVAIASDQGALAVTQSGGWSTRTQDGSGNNLTSLALGGQRSITVAVVDASGNQITAFGGAGGTASNYTSAFPSSGTAIGFSDGTNMQGARVVDLDTGGGTVYALINNLVRRASGGPVELIGSSTSATSLPVVIASDQGAFPISSITTSITPGVGALNLGKAEDTQHVTGDVGVVTFAVRQSTPTDLSTGGVNGDYEPLQVDANNRLWTNPFPTAPVASTYLPIRVTDGSNFIVSSVDYQHNTLLTPATTTGPAIFYRASAAAPANVTADNYATLGWALPSGAAVVQLSAGGALIGGDAVNGLKIQCISGCAGSGGTSLVDRAGYVAGTTAGTPLMAARDDTAPATLGEDLVGIVRQSTNRELYTVLRDAAGNNRGANVDASGNLAVVATANASVNVAQVNGGTTSTVAAGVQKVGIADSGGNAFLSAANALNSTGLGLSASQLVAQFDDTAPTAITENQFGNSRMSANRNLYATLRDAAGNERGVNINAGNELLVNPYSSTPAAGTYQTVRVTDGTSYLAQASDYTQDIALTVASTAGPMTMGRASAAAPTAVGADNRAVMQWMSLAGASMVQPTYGGILAVAGNGVAGTGVQRVTLASDSTGQVTLAAGAATIGALTANQSVNVAQINGVTPLMGNGASGTGAARVTIANDSTGQIALAAGAATIGALTANQSVNNTQINGVALSVGIGATGTGVQRVADVSSGSTGAAPPAQAKYIAGVTSGATGGFLAGITVCDQSKPVNISTATTTLMVTGVSGRQVRICSFHFVTAAANNVAWLEGTGATCGTGTAGMAGGTTAASGYNFAANGGIAAGSGFGEVLTTATTGDSACLITSAATQLSGFIKYAIY